MAWSLIILLSYPSFSCVTPTQFSWSENNAWTGFFQNIRQKWCSSILSFSSNDVRIVTLPWNVLNYPMAKSNFNYNILAPQKVNSTFPCVFQLIFKPHLSRDSFIKLTTLICIPRQLSAKLISIWRGYVTEAVLIYNKHDTSITENGCLKKRQKIDKKKSLRSGESREVWTSPSPPPHSSQ